MPLKTISAFRDHGRVRGATVQQGLELAQAQLDLLRSLNIDLDAVTEKLQQEGLAGFTASLDKLLDGIARKCHAACA
jgi:transaldolase